MNVNAIWVTQPGKIEIRPLEVEAPRYDEVTVEVKACGVCAWDSYLFQGITGPGPCPYVIGHEAVGIISAVGEGVTHLKVGDKVFCASGSNIMMAEAVTLPADAVARIPDDVTDWSAWVAEPTCCVVNLLRLTHIQPGDRVVLVGAGYMGLLTLQGLRAEPQGSVTVFEKRSDRRKLAEGYGYSEVYDPDSPEGQEKIEAIAASGGADVVIDFSASDSGFALCQQMFSKGGTFVIGSWHRHEMTFDGTLWHMSGQTVLNLAPNSNRHYRDNLPRTASLIERGVYCPGELVSHVADYRNCEEIFLRSIDKKDGYMKGVITFNL